MATRGAYVAYSLTAGTSNNVNSGMTRYVQPGQAFFVQNSTAGGNSLVFKETAKGSASSQTATFGMEPVKDYASLSAILYYTDSLTIGLPPMDATRVLFSSRFSSAVDGDDGRKFANLDESMSVRRGTSNLSMELRAPADSATKIPLNITQYVQKKYTLRMLWDEPLLDDTLVAYVRDKYLSVEQPINRLGNTDVEYVLDTSAKSSASDRFEIVFRSTANTVSAIVGPSMVCVGMVTQLQNDTPLGQWSSSNSAVAVVDSLGRVKGMKEGMVEIGYTVTKNGSTKTVTQSIRVQGIPVQQVVSRDGSGNLVSGVTEGNQWYREGVLIAGATGQVYKPLEAGYYSVRVTLNGCAGALSQGYYYAVTGLLDARSGEYVRMFPNPVLSEVKLEFMVMGSRMVDVEVYDMAGRLVVQRKSVVTGTKLNLTGLAQGMYRYQVRDRNGRLMHTEKFMKE
jgi:hypothetical protein